MQRFAACQSDVAVFIQTSRGEVTRRQIACEVGVASAGTLRAISRSIGDGLSRRLATGPAGPAHSPHRASPRADGARWPSTHATLFRSGRSACSACSACSGRAHALADRRSRILAPRWGPRRHCRSLPDTHTPPGFDTSIGKTDGTIDVRSAAWRTMSDP
jgi:hypothetical protein